MSNKNEILKIGLLTALVAFRMLGVFAAVAAPGDGIVSSAYAFMSPCHLLPPEGVPRGVPLGVRRG
jgi:hypothetical protein